jgi:transcriptional regulator with XRE-family HTH domain
MNSQANIPALLAQSPLTEADIAKIANVNRSTVLRWKSGMVPSKPEAIAGLARALGIHPRRVRFDLWKVLK